MPAPQEMAIFRGWRLLSELPGPVMSLLGFSVQTKLEVTSYSFGDNSYFLAYYSRFALGGFRIVIFWDLNGRFWLCLSDASLGRFSISFPSS